MALPIFNPAITKTKKAITQTSQRAVLRLVPELESGKPATNRSLTILGTITVILVALVMFVITTFSTHDAFTLAKLQRDSQTVSDQLEAIDRKLAYLSSPTALAIKAQKMGMKPNNQPRFIDISGEING